MEEQWLVAYTAGNCFAGVLQHPSMEDIKEGTVVTLTNVRELRSFAEPIMGPYGQPTGMGRLVVMLPIHRNNGPVEKMMITPTAWYDPAASAESWKSFQDLMGAAEKMESQTKAQQAGISLPRNMS